MAALRVLSDSLYGVMAAALSLVITPWVRTMALWLGRIDQPGGRRVHQSSIPRLGGLAVLVSWFGTLGFVLLIDPTLHDMVLSADGRWLWLLLGVLSIVALGVADDIWDLKPVLKLGLQVVAGVMLIAGDVMIIAVANPVTGSHLPLGSWSVPVTLLWVIGVTNSFNLLYGQHGLAAGVALIAAMTLWAIGMATGQGGIALLPMLLAGALTGFLYHNFYPASIFLGDSGSLLLGYVLAALSIQIVRDASHNTSMLTAFLVLGLPLLDTLFAILRRLWRSVRTVRRDPQYRSYHVIWLAPVTILQPDRGHFHHRLLSLGLSPRCATMLLYGGCAGLCLSSFPRFRWFGIVMLAVVLALILITSIRTKRDNAKRNG